MIRKKSKCVAKRRSGKVKRPAMEPPANLCELVLSQRGEKTLYQTMRKQLAAMAPLPRIEEMFQGVRAHYPEPNIVVARDMQTAETLTAMYPQCKRPRTILLLEGINALTGRPVRIYCSPTDKLTCVETIAEGQLKRQV